MQRFKNVTMPNGRLHPGFAAVPNAGGGVAGNLWIISPR
jgi:hypothetical protein